MLRVERNSRAETMRSAGHVASYLLKPALNSQTQLNKMQTPDSLDKSSTMPVNILLGKHHDITSFASKDESRYIINSVHYNAKAGVLEATDGTILIRVPVIADDNKFPPVSIDGTAKDITIPLGPFKRALSNIPKSTLPIIEHMRLSVTSKSDKEMVNLVTTDLETEQNVACKPVEGEYPNVDNVIPTKEPSLVICIRSALLKQIADYAERHGKGGCGIKFEFIDARSPIRFSFPLETPTQATGVMMPIRNL